LAFRQSLSAGIVVKYLEPRLTPSVPQAIRTLVATLPHWGIINLADKELHMTAPAGKKMAAVYRTGAFVPKAPCDLPEGAEVELTIQGPSVLSPAAMSDEERAQLLQTVIARMQTNLIPSAAPRLTREILHERG
jgi:predicted DNA-binding antitoxin AbrB/MazE fold protein